MQNFYLSYITIGVTDLEALKYFYCRLFHTKPFKETDQYFFIKIGNINLAFCAWDYLQNKQIPLAKGNGKGLLSINVWDEPAVDKMYEALTHLNANIIQEPAHLSNNCYHLYFTDIENNSWEIIYNPAFSITE